MILEVVVAVDQVPYACRPVAFGMWLCGKCQADIGHEPRVDDRCSCGAEVVEVRRNAMPASIA